MIQQGSLGWYQVVHKVTKESHVLPENDIREHDFSKDCWCHPIDDPQCPEEQWMHNAADGRGDFEDNKRKLS